MSRQHQPACFVSYCHQDGSRGDLDYLLFLLAAQASNKFQIKIDHHLPPGADLNEFMKEVENPDVKAVILVLTPGYKQQVLKRSGGVYTEYSMIMQRYQRDLEDRKTSLIPENDPDDVSEEDSSPSTGDVPNKGRFAILPIIFSGDRETSVPDDIKHLWSYDFRNLRAVTDSNGDFVISNHIRQHYLREIANLCDQVAVLGELSRAGYSEKYRDVSRDLALQYEQLFRNLRASWHSGLFVSKKDLEAVFVKTFTYTKLRNNSIFLTVGRKGSGKSTVAQVLAIMEREHYKGLVQIDGEDFNLEAAYALLSSLKMRSELESIYSRFQYFQFAWEAFLIISAMDVLKELSEKGKLREYQESHIDSIARFMNKLRNKWPELDSKKSKGPYFMYVFSELNSFIDDCIADASTEPSQFFTDLQGMFNRERYLAKAIGKEVLGDFYAIVSTCQKHLLITLDGFDTAFDLFRKRSLETTKDAELERRSTFEIDWLVSLLHLVLRMRENIGGSKFYSLVEFCITVPRDRFVEILRSDRDAYRFQNQYWSLDWSGIELAILLRKRLEKLFDQETDRHDHRGRPRLPEVRLREVWTKTLSHIPWDIDFVHDGQRYEMPLFMYVLRHTFWRPRDLLTYYANIITVANDMKQREGQITSDGIRRVVKETTFDVIRKEFIREFSYTVRNITEIIEAFDGSKQLLTFEEVGDVISKEDFVFVANSADKLKIEEKIDFLYRIGFLGLKFSKEDRDELGIQHQHAFAFNEGDVPIRGGTLSRFQQLTYVIHPVFSEYLRLDTRGNGLVLRLDWEYLHKMEALLSATGTGL